MYIELVPGDITVKLKELKGIYFVYSLIHNKEVVYVGCSRNIYKRFKAHRYHKPFDKIDMFSMATQKQAKIKERELIVKHMPRLNGNGKHSKCTVILNSERYRSVSSLELKYVHSSILNR